jgi:heme a synthase
MEHEPVETIDYAATRRSGSTGAVCRGRYRLAIATSMATLLLIVAGGNVTSKGAGLAVPDWPLSFGSVNPRGWIYMPGVRDEHGHRLIGMVTGFLLTLLTGWILAREPRRWVRRLAIAAWVAVVIQGIMGGLRVTEISLKLAVVHGCFAHAFFGMVVALMVVSSPAWVLSERGSGLEFDRRLRVWLPILIGSLFGQLILGAILRHTRTGTSLHIAGAIVVGCLVVQVLNLAFGQPSTERRVHRWLLAVVGLYILQVALGLVTLLVRDQRLGYTSLAPLAPYLPTVHVAVGALILAVVVYATLWAYLLTDLGKRSDDRGASCGELR